MSSWPARSGVSDQTRHAVFSAGGGEGPETVSQPWVAPCTKDVRALALADPRGFLGQGDHLILDEIQRAPDLLPHTPPGNSI